MPTSCPAQFNVQTLFSSGLVSNRTNSYCPHQLISNSVCAAAANSLFKKKAKKLHRTDVLNKCSSSRLSLQIASQEVEWVSRRTLFFTLKSVRWCCVSGCVTGWTTLIRHLLLNLEGYKWFAEILIGRTCAGSLTALEEALPDRCQLSLPVILNE